MVDACPDQVVRGKRLRVDDLDRRVDRGDAIALDAPDDRHAPPAHLRVQKRVDDVDGDLVSQLGTRVCVADDEDVRHAREPIDRPPVDGWVG